MRITDLAGYPLLPDRIAASRGLKGPAHLDFEGLPLSVLEADFRAVGNKKLRNRMYSKIVAQHARRSGFTRSPNGGGRVNNYDRS